MQDRIDLSGLSSLRIIRMDRVRAAAEKLCGLTGLEALILAAFLVEEIDPDAELFPELLEWFRE